MQLVISTPARRTCGDSGGRNNNGAPCRVFLNLSEDNGCCFRHDPIRRAKFLTAEGEGLENAKVKRRLEKLKRRRGFKAPRTMEDATTQSAKLYEYTVIGEIDEKTSRACSQALNQFREAFKLRDMEQRLRAAEARVKVLEGLLEKKGLRA